MCDCTVSHFIAEVVIDMKKTGWIGYSEKELNEVHELNERYKAFLDAGKTERECVDQTVSRAREAGYRDLDDVIRENGKLAAGDKVYAVCMNKTVALFNIGSRPLEEGMRVLGAHIDSPRLDVKQNPLYEDTGMAFLDTHYYGGVKKYQWVTIPLAMHGVVAKKDGSLGKVCIGEKDDDPVLCITDLLIHLSADQLEKKARVVIEGEKLDVLIGSRPLETKKDAAEGKEADGSENDSSDHAAGKEKEAVRANMLALLKECYGIEEDDFLSAELEIVPAGRARDCGLDRSMVASYGHDDRVCAYTTLEAFLATKEVEYTACCLLVDKEEIGSVGATGMQSRFFENTVAELMNCAGEYSELALRRCLKSSRMLSSDVSAALDPLYAEVFEKKNAAYLGKGLVFNKFTGARGKSGSNDANAEYLGWIRRVMDEGNVAWQTAELGKVDVGGGGTIAYICALYGMEVVDSGVAVLNMHAPLEVVSKLDVYEAKKGYIAFLKG